MANDLTNIKSDKNVIRNSMMELDTYQNNFLRFLDNVDVKERPIQITINSIGSTFIYGLARVAVTQISTGTLTSTKWQTLLPNDEYYEQFQTNDFIDSGSKNVTESTPLVLKGMLYRPNTIKNRIKPILNWETEPSSYKIYASLEDGTAIFYKELSESEFNTLSTDLDQQTYYEDLGDGTLAASIPMYFGVMNVDGLNIKITSESNGTLKEVYCKLE